MKPNILFRSLVLVAVLMVSACTPAPFQPHVITPQGAMISLELADSPEERTIGLMGRKSLPADSGMLFIFDEPQQVGFWMKNTLIPLDAVYIDQDKKVIDIKTMTPCPAKQSNCPSYPAAAPVLYALEINGGMAEELGLKVGDQLQIVLTPPNK